HTCISLSQQPPPLSWTVRRQRSPDGTPAFHAGSPDLSSILMRERNRHHAAFAPCVLGRTSPSCRFSSPALPLASTTQRAVTSRDPPSPASDTRCAAAGSSVIDRTRQPSST